MSATQDSTVTAAHDLGYEADNAIDGDMATSSHTRCSQEENWLQVELVARYCVDEVKVFQEKHNKYAKRMNNARVYVSDSSNESDEQLCGKMEVTDDYTIEGQTYTISCGMKCGNFVTLRSSQDDPCGVGLDNEDECAGCIHVSEIEVYTNSFTGRDSTKSGEKLYLHADIISYSNSIRNPRRSDAKLRLLTDLRKTDG